MSMPSALTISRSSAPARTSMPTRVRFTSHHSPSATSAPVTMKASLATGYSNPGASGTAPCNTAGMTTSGGGPPHPQPHQRTDDDEGEPRHWILESRRQRHGALQHGGHVDQRRAPAEQQA